jgi:hypothetical protein
MERIAGSGRRLAVLSVILVGGVVAAVGLTLKSASSKPEVPAGKAPYLRNYQQQLDRATRPAGRVDPQEFNALLDRVAPASGRASAPYRQGIIETGQAPLPSSIYLIRNRWQMLGPDGNHTVVYAGGYTSEPNRGVIVVHVSSPSFAALESTTYEAPGSPGSLRITGAEGMRLTLAGSAGEPALTFNIATRQFSVP